MTRRRELSGNAPGVAWPPVFAQHAHLAALAMTLEQTQWLDPTELAERQGEQLALLVAHHAQASPSFARRLAAAGLSPDDLTHPDMLRKLPVLTRGEAQQLGDAEPATVPESHMPLFEVQSSGSSGIPVTVRKTQLSRLMWMAQTLRYHDWAGGDYGSMVTIRPNLGLGRSDDNWGIPVALFHKTGPIHRLNSDMPIVEQAAQLASLRPDALMTYPSTINALLGMGDAGRAALQSVKMIKTIGETLSPELRSHIEAETGARLFDCYSAEEVGYIALQCPDTQFYHIMSEALIVELLDADGRPARKGQPGRVVATDLHNFATPVIRYDTGDYAVRAGPCPCGRGLPTIKQIMGRWRGMIVKPDGSRHWPRTGFHDYRSIAPVRQYQMIQHAVDRIELRLVLDEPLTTDQTAAFKEHLRKTVGDAIEFDISRFPDRLPSGPQGKTDEFISLIGE